MRLYCFQTGYIVMDKSMLTAWRDIGTIVTVPIPFFLIQHPKGNLLYDTGLPKQLVSDSRSYWGDMLVDILHPALKEEDYCVNHLAGMGIKPGDIKYVVQSHLHLDHTGGVMDFPDATVFVQRKEIEWAYTADPTMKMIYNRGDFDHPHIKYRYIEGWNQNPFDVFGDGSVRILFTPGHTPGHQSLLVDLPETGRVLLTGDACYTLQNLEEEVMPGVAWNLEETRKSIEMIRHLGTTGVRIFIGHDPEVWATYRKAPEYYA
jgi:N-acyl homoserine lactone hydrolase